MSLRAERGFKEKVTVRFVRREDGGLQAICDAIPGFYLSGSDKSAVYRDVIPALEALVKHNLDISVEAYPLKLGIYALVEREQPETTIPDEQEYVLERLAA